MQEFPLYFLSVTIITSLVATFRCRHCYLFMSFTMAPLASGHIYNDSFEVFATAFHIWTLVTVRFFLLHFPNESFPCSCVCCFRFWHFSYWFVENSFRVNILGIISIVCLLCMCLMERLDYFKEVFFSQRGSSEFTPHRMQGAQ